MRTRRAADQQFIFFWQFYATVLLVSLGLCGLAWWLDHHGYHTLAWGPVLLAVPIAWRLMLWGLRQLAIIELINVDPE